MLFRYTHKPVDSAMLRKRAFEAALVLLVICMGVFSLLPSSVKVIEAFSGNNGLPIYSVETPLKNVSITFDCAWGADDIPEILDILERENVKATFFIVGLWAEKNPGTVKIISEAGHDVANHGYAHLRMGVLDKESNIEEISKCHNVLYSITNRKPDLFRPPYGDYTSGVIAAAEGLGYYSIQWDVDSLDWKKTMTPSDIISRVTGRCRNGSIILFHNDTKHTVEVLPKIIKTLKNKGFGFLPISKLIIRENYIIDHSGRQKTAN